jgi:hypothetical protein
MEKGGLNLHESSLTTALNGRAGPCYEYIPSSKPNQLSSKTLRGMTLDLVQNLNRANILFYFYLFI